MIYKYLFEAIDNEVLKTENIQNTNIMKSFGTLQGHIQLSNNPLEKLGIQGHGQRVARILGISYFQRSGDGLTAHLSLDRSKGLAQAAGFNLQL